MTDNQMLIQSMGDNTLWITGSLIIIIALIVHYMSNNDDDPNCGIQNY